MERVRSRRPGRGIPPAPPAIGVRRVLWLLRQAAGVVAAAAEPSRRKFRGRRIGLSPGHLFRGVWRTFRARPLLVASCVAILAAGIGSATAVAAAAPASSCGRCRFLTPIGSSPVTRCARASIRSAPRCSMRRVQVPRGLVRTDWSRPAADLDVRAGGDAVRVQAAAVTADYLAAAAWRRHTGARSPGGRSAGQCRRCCDQPLVLGPAVRRAARHRRSQPDDRWPIRHGDRHPAPRIRPAFAAEIWVPLQVAIDTPLQDRLASAYMPLARLRPGVAIDRANQEIAAVVKALADEYPQRRGWTCRAIGLRQQLLGDLDGRTTNCRAGARGGRFLLVICCVNVANLLLLRAADRERDEAIARGVGRSARAGTALRITGHRADGRRRPGLTAWLAPVLGALNPIRPSALAPALTEFASMRS